MGLVVVWTDQYTCDLTCGWICTSEDEINAVYQRAQRFYHPLFDLFTSLTPEGPNCKQYKGLGSYFVGEKWYIVSTDCQKLCATLRYKRASKLTSLSEDQIFPLTILKHLSKRYEMACDTKDFPCNQLARNLSLKVLCRVPKFKEDVIMSDAIDMSTPIQRSRNEEELSNYFFSTTNTPPVSDFPSNDAALSKCYDNPNEMGGTRSVVCEARADHGGGKKAKREQRNENFKK